MAKMSNPRYPNIKKAALKIFKIIEHFEYAAKTEYQMVQRISYKPPDYIEPEENEHLLRMYSSFSYKNHSVIVYEVLGMNLWSMMRPKFRQKVRKGFPLLTISKVALHVTLALNTIHSKGLIHGDIKPENITSLFIEQEFFKLVDYGSSLKIYGRHPRVIQTIYYRAPEVLLEMNYNHKIDIWSLGALLVELFILSPLFPAQNRGEVLHGIQKIIGPIPIEMVAESRVREQLFTDTGELLSAELIPKMLGDADVSSEFPRSNLMHIIRDYKHWDSNTEDRDMEIELRSLFYDFVAKCLTIDPNRRPDTGILLRHPFIAGFD